MKPEHLKNPPPQKILYHYTSQEGLIGILTHRCIWASKIHYMNDSKELQRSFELVGEWDEQEASNI